MEQLGTCYDTMREGSVNEAAYHVTKLKERLIVDDGVVFGTKKGLDPLVRVCACTLDRLRHDPSRRMHASCVSRRSQSDLATLACTNFCK